jgi:HEAT repeat protein
MLRLLGEEALFKRLANRDEYIMGTAWALVDMADKDSPLLPKYLKAKELKTRWLILWAYGASGNKQAVGLLMSYVGDQTKINSWVRDIDMYRDTYGQYAIDALEKITGLRYGNDVAKWRAWWAKQKKP